MEIKYQGHEQRKRKASDLWLRVGTDYNGGMPAREIAKRYTNPKTGKHYTREHIYWILNKLKTEPIKNY